MLRIVAMFRKFASLRPSPEVCVALERLIVRHPEQWFWVHRRWKRAPTNVESDRRKESRATLPSQQDGLH